MWVEMLIELLLTSVLSMNCILLFISIISLKGISRKKSDSSSIGQIFLFPL